MERDEQRPVPFRTWAAAGTGLVLAVAWFAGRPSGGGPDARPQNRPPPATAAAAVPPVAAGTAHPPAGHAAHAPLPPVVPVRIDVPAIGLHAAVIPRGLAAGSVEPPPYSAPGVAGWWRDGPRPGTRGAALVVGHVDTPTGPAVFYRLGTVRPGALVEVTRADGSVAEFTVDAVETVAKDRFPAQHVYGSGERPELRLITCGGTFDQTRREYSANVVVFTTLTGAHPAVR